MGKYWILTMAVFLLTGTAVNAQFSYKRTVNDTLKSVQLNRYNKSAIFRIYAPETKTVSIDCEAIPWGQKLDFTKHENGVWEAVLKDVISGSYRYTFNVDGVAVIDPKDWKARQQRPVLDIDWDGNAFWSMKNISHGAVSQVLYYSKIFNCVRSAHIWTPAGYNKMQNLPVLYLIHGGGDSDYSWTGVGHANFILDNLLSEGKMQPMVVVMPDGGVDTDKFVDDLMDELIPYVEMNYSVLKDYKHRAIAGLSMGGLETLNVIQRNYKDFAYVNVMSSGWFIDNKAMNENGAKRLMEVGKEMNKYFKLLLFTQGGPEDIAYKNCKHMLTYFDNAGIKYEFSEHPGGHTWPVWKLNLYNFAQRIFK